MKLLYQYIAIFFNFSPTSNHLHPIQVENCDSNSRLVVDEDDNDKSGLKGLNRNIYRSDRTRRNYNKVEKARVWRWDNIKETFDQRLVFAVKQ